MLKTIVKVALVTLPVTYTTFDNIGYICRVEGNSMKPLITPSKDYTNYIFLSRWGYQRFELNRGDVICLICPTNPKQRILKRIIGLEGDTIKTRNYNEEYVRVGKGHCWIEGDNHKNSLDSNAFGSVPVGLIQSKATHLVWPKFCKIPTLDVINRIKSHVEADYFEEAEFKVKHKDRFFIKSVRSGRPNEKDGGDVSGFGGQNGKDGDDVGRFAGQNGDDGGRFGRPHGKDGGRCGQQNLKDAGGEDGFEKSKVVVEGSSEKCCEDLKNHNDISRVHNKATLPNGTTENIIK